MKKVILAIFSVAFLIPMLTVQARSNCDICDGSGICQTCMGSGKFGEHWEDDYLVEDECYDCGGSGDCWHCNGSGYLD